MMRILSYPIIIFLFNYVLYKSFPSGGGGTGLGFLITWPIILIATLLVMGAHFYAQKKEKRTGYFQLFSISVLIIFSYVLFIKDPDNSPLDIIKRMVKVGNEYSKITKDDFFVEYKYYNFEKIVAAKKKFNHLISDTTYSVKIKNRYTDNVLNSYNILYEGNCPISSNKDVIIQKIAKDTFRFSNYIDKDTLSFYATPNYISDPIGERRDSFMNYGAGYAKDTTIKEMLLEKDFKDETPDNKYWAYKIYYFLL